MSSNTKTTAMKEEATPALMPKLRFPEFQDSDDWQSKLLGDLCKIRTGKKDANEGASDGQYPFFTCAENHIFSNSYSFDAEAILIAGNANVGQTRYYNGKFEAYQRTYVLTDFSGISVPYLYAILNAKLRESLLAHVQVSAMSYIKLPMLQEYALAVPPSPAEQQKIAECLSSQDELIAAQARKLDALKTHKKGLMQQLFPREGETQPRLRFPEFQNAGEWVEQPLGQLIEVASGQVDPKQPPYCDSPQIGSENIESHSGKLVNVKSAGDKGVISGNYAFDENDILYSKIRPALNKVAAPAFKGICSADIYPIRPADGSLLRSYLFYLLLSQEFLDYAIRNSERGKIPKINRDALVTYKALIPSPDEQQRIADCLTSLDDLIAAQTQKHEALKTHKKGLMQQLFPSPEEPTNL
jgi:type I restriction enzyme S subunit